MPAPAGAVPAGHSFTAYGSPPEADAWRLANTGVALLRRGDVVGAEKCLRASGELRGTAGAVARLNRAAALGWQAITCAPGSATWEAGLEKASQLAIGARRELTDEGASPTLVASCYRTQAALRAWRGWPSSDPEHLDAAVCLQQQAIATLPSADEDAVRRSEHLRALAICTRVLAQATGDESGLATARRHLDQAEHVLVSAGLHTGRPEIDMARAALAPERSPVEAASHSVPAALVLASQRHQLSGTAARAHWASAHAEPALDDALRDAEEAGLTEVASALVVWRRLAGIVTLSAVPSTPMAFERAWGDDDSILVPLPRLRGVFEPLEPYLACAAERYAVPLGQLVDDAWADLVPL